MNAIAVSANRMSPMQITRAYSHRWIGWLPLALLPPAVMVFQSTLVPWLFMWLLAVAIFAGCKWQTWWTTHSRHARSWRRSLAYLLLWPGMDADQFLATETGPPTVEAREWREALIKTLAGALLIWTAVRVVPVGYPLPAAWIGMLGIILFLHFGVFHLISAAWRSAGVCAEPIMHQPLKSRSLGEFWGQRWNLGFRNLSHALVFGPLQKRFGVIAGTLGAFLVSGLIHDLTISVPARAGYGLPTAYFLIQGCGVIAERSGAGKRLGLGHGFRGWLWMAVVTAGPLFILFHPWFALRVILPFLRAIVP
jgi:Membrane bound O-acyl transferase family